MGLGGIAQSETPLHFAFHGAAREHCEKRIRAFEQFLTFRGVGLQRWARQRPVVSYKGKMDLKNIDAFQYLVTCLKATPDGFRDVGYDVYLPHIVDRFLREARIEPFNAHISPELDDLRRAFHDAAWRLCRMGVLRSTAAVPREVGGGGIRETGFSYTGAGREWLKNAEPGYVPVESARYLAALSRADGILKSPAFLQRAAEAARSHEACNYLACCAMCGAAAESALLALAIAKTGSGMLLRFGNFLADSWTELTGS